MRLDAYYYGFDPTGNLAVDNILSAVACAGKAYHLTEDWSGSPLGGECRPYEPTHRGTTPVQWIQNAANDAAKEHALLLDVATAATVALYKFGDEYEGRLGPLRNAIDALMAFRSGASEPSGNAPTGQEQK